MMCTSFGGIYSYYKLSIYASHDGIYHSLVMILLKMKRGFLVSVTFPCELPLREVLKKHCCVLNADPYWLFGTQMDLVLSRCD